MVLAGPNPAQTLVSEANASLPVNLRLELEVMKKVGNIHFKLTSKGTQVGMLMGSDAVRGPVRDLEIFLKGYVACANL